MPKLIIRSRHYMNPKVVNYVATVDPVTGFATFTGDRELAKRWDGRDLERVKEVAAGLGEIVVEHSAGERREAEANVNAAEAFEFRRVGIS